MKLPRLTPYITLLFLWLPTSALMTQTSDPGVDVLVDSLIRKSRFHTENYEFEKAIEYGTSALLLTERELGDASAAYARTCFNIGRIFHFAGLEYCLEAEKWYLTAKGIQEPLLPEVTNDYGWTLHNLADINRQLTRYKEAEEAIQGAIRVRSQLGKQTVDYASSLESYGVLMYDLAEYHRAEQYFQDCLAIRAIISTRESGDYAQILGNLANVYDKMGRYAQSESFYLEALAIRKKMRDKAPKSYGLVLGNLGTLYYTLGKYDEAEKLLLEAVDVLRNAGYTEGHATALTSLASVYISLTRYEQAEQLYRQSLEMLKDNAIMQAHIKTGLAHLCGDVNKWTEAEVLYLEAKSIWEALYSEPHPDYAASLHNLAGFYALNGSFEKAEQSYLASLSTLEKSMLGKSHPEYGKGLVGLGMLYSANRRYGQAEPLFAQAVQISRDYLQKAVFFLSETDLGSYLQKENLDIQRIQSYLHSGHFSQKLAQTVYDDVLFQKGFLQTAARRLNIMTAVNPEVDAMRRELKSYKQQLYQEYTKPADLRSDMSVVDSAVNALESRLSRILAGDADLLKGVHWRDIQDALKPDEAAIEFLRFKDYFPTETDTQRYAALILRRDMEAPAFVYLCDEWEINRRVPNNVKRSGDYVKQLYQLSSRGVIVSGQDKSRSLYDMLWKPMEPYMTGVRTVYYANAGLLHRINLGAIRVNLDSVLADCHQLVTLNSTRSLVVPDKYEVINQNGLVMGGILYDPDTTALGLSLFSLDTISYATRSAVQFYRADTGPTEYWPSLLYSPREADNIGRTLKKSLIACLVLKGYNASEEAFYKAVRLQGSSPRVIHMATHGYFFADPTESGAGAGESVFKLTEHPLIRSGLILAGGNYAWSTGTPVKPGLEDGILTAYEISQLNLSGTELVVLSACETGLGDIQGNEGVYGLQRAFKIAGARYLIMSLWEVPDEDSQKFMSKFYTLWLEQGMSIPDAFRKTQADFRAVSQQLWAGFVLLE
jgi:CHAT domain-containing protein/uncharacterized protein HemY